MARPLPGGRYSSRMERIGAAARDVSASSWVAELVSRSTITRFCSAGFPLGFQLIQAGPQETAGVLDVVQAADAFTASRQVGGRAARQG
jgi:hypothetical protein